MMAWRHRLPDDEEREAAHSRPERDVGGRPKRRTRHMGDADGLAAGRGEGFRDLVERCLIHSVTGLKLGISNASVNESEPC
jgi:hypothetical protein